MEVTASANRASSTTRSAFGIVVALAACGLGLSAYLTLAHVSGNPVPCPLKEDLDCAAALQGPAAMLVGVPISAWGFVAYLATLVSALRAFAARRAPPLMPLCCDVLLFGTAMLLTRLFVRVHVPCGWCLASAAIVATIFAACSVAVHRSAGAVARRIVGALAMSSAYGVLLLSTGAQVEEAGALQESSVDAFVVTKAQVASLDEAISYVVKSGKPTLLLAFDRECARCELLAAVLFDMERAGRFRGLSWITVRARNDVPHLRRIARTLPIVALVNDRGVVANVIEGDISRADVEALLVHARR